MSQSEQLALPAKRKQGTKVLVTTTLRLLETRGSQLHMNSMTERHGRRRKERSQAGGRGSRRRIEDGTRQLTEAQPDRKKSREAHFFE